MFFSKTKKQRTLGLPGLTGSLSYTLFYLGIMVLIPLFFLFYRISDLPFSFWTEILSSDRLFSAIRLTFLTAFISAILNAFVGFLIAWCLVRYRFYGKWIVDLFIDLPFALPTAVVGITLADLYSQNGFLGQHLLKLNLLVSYTPIGIVIALMVVGLPFVVRSVEPVLKEIDPQTEEAAKCLGATSFQVFRKVIFPPLIPSLLTGTTLSFARALGEYGSVVFISGNMPFKTEVAPLLIMSKLEQFDYDGAAVIAITMLLISLGLFLLISRFQAYKSKTLGMDS